MAFENLKSISSSACQFKVIYPGCLCSTVGTMVLYFSLTQKAVVKIHGKKCVKFLRVPKIDEVPFCTLFFLFCWLCCLLFSVSLCLALCFKLQAPSVFLSNISTSMSSQKNQYT